MFDNLVESNRSGRRDVKGTVMGMFGSTVFQAAVMVAAVYATMGVAQESEAFDIDTIMMVLDEPEQQEEQPEEEAPPVVTSLAPPPKGFQVLTAPVDIPTEIPPKHPLPSAQTSPLPVGKRGPAGVA